MLERGDDVLARHQNDLRQPRLATDLNALLRKTRTGDHQTTRLQRPTANLDVKIGDILVTQRLGPADGVLEGLSFVEACRESGIPRGSQSRYLKNLEEFLDRLCVDAEPPNFLVG